jgi:hypothetical protein
MAGFCRRRECGRSYPSRSITSFLTSWRLCGLTFILPFRRAENAQKKPTDAAQFKLWMPKHAIKVYLRAIHKFFMDTVSHELGRGLERGANAISRASE